MEKDLRKHLLDFDEFDIDIPLDEPIFTLTAICRLLHMEYHRLHEIVEQEIVKPKKIGKRKKLFSYNDIKYIKYVQYLIEDEGVNINGVRIIMEMIEKE